MRGAITEINRLNAAVAQTAINARAGNAAAASVGNLRQAFLSNINTLKGWRSHAVQIEEPIKATTEAIRRQELTMRQWRDGLGKSRHGIRQLAEHQLALRQAMVTTWTSKDGIINADVLLPQKVVSTMRQRTGYMLGMQGMLMQNFGAEMVKRGKDIQWAGRQLTVGLTVPLAMLGALATKTAYDVDKSLTRLAKVYDFTADGAAGNMQNLRTEAMDFSKTLQEEFGQTTKETVDMMTTFAQMGKSGRDLQALTRMATEISFLGETDTATAVEATRVVMDAFKLSVEDTRATLFRFNQIENDTVLSIEDLANELPGVAGSLSAFGFKAEEGAAMLAALKEQAVPVDEAVTAMRTGFARIFAPTDRAQKMFGRLGINLRTLREDFDDPMDAMYHLADRLKDINSEQERFQYLATLFDVRQTDKWIRLFRAMEDGARQTGAFGTAMEIATMTATEAIAKGEQEMRIQQESMSGRIDRIKAQLQGLMEGIGMQLLPGLIGIMDTVLSIVRGFTNLPQGLQRTLRFIALFVAIAGPLRMLQGLVMNLVGMLTAGFGKGIVKVAKFASGFSILDEKMIATRAATDRMTEGLKGQVAPIEMVEQQIRQLTLALQQLDVAQSQVSNNPPPVNPVTGAGGQMMLPGMGAPVQGQFDLDDTSSNSLIATSAAAEKASGSMDKAGKSTGRLSRGFKGLTGNMGATAGSMVGMIGLVGSMATENGTLANTLFNVASVAGFIIPVLAQLKIAFAGTWAAALGPIGAVLAAIAVLGFGFKKLSDHVDKTSDTSFKATEAAQKAAEAVGAQWSETVVTINAAGEAIESQTARSQKFEQANKETVQRWREMAAEWRNLQRQTISGGQDTEESSRVRDDLRGEALTMAYTMRQHGATPEEAKQAVQDGLDAAGAAEIATQIKIDYSNMNQLAKAASEELNRAMTNVMDPQASRSFWDEFFNPLTEHSQEQVGNMELVSQSLYDALASGDPQQVVQSFDVIATQLEQRSDSMLKQFEMASRGLTETDWEYFKHDGINPLDPSTWDKVADSVSRASTVMSPAAQSMMKDILAYRETMGAFTGQIEKAFGIPEGTLKEVDTMTGIVDELGGATNSSAATLLQYSHEIYKAEKAGTKLTKAEKEALYVRLAVANGIMTQAEAERNATAAVEGADAALQQQMDTQERYADLIGRVRDKIRSQLEGVVEGLMENFDRAHEKNMDAFDDETERESESFDDRLENSDEFWNNRLERRRDYWDDEIKESDEHFDDLIKGAEKQATKDKDAVNKAADNRINRLKNVIDAEERVDERRQFLFDRERARIDYMAGAETRDIEFNMALSTGDLGQAAIIRATAQSEEQNFYLDEQEAAAERRKEINKDRVDRSIEGIDRERDRDIKTIDRVLEKDKERWAKMKERRREDLEHQRDINLKRLENEREAAREAIEIQKEAYTDMRQADREAAEARYQTFRAAREKEFQDLLRSTPKTRAEYKDLLEKLENAYNGYGGRVERLSEGWSNKTARTWRSGINEAAREMAEDDSWEEHGATAGDSVIQGMLGMNMKEFQHWVNTGEIKKFRGPDVSELTGWERSAAANANRHSGGVIGQNPGRTMHPLKHDEVRAVLQKGEYVVNRRAVADIGVSNLNRINKGIGGGKRLPSGEGQFHEGGLAGGFASLVAGAMRGALISGVSQVVNRRNQDIMEGRAQRQVATPRKGGMARFVQDFGSGAVGDLEGFDRAQEKVASQIISIGHALGATNKMILAALAAGIVESGLRNLNYGDRDSLGIFQQRPSMAWGSAEQIMNPEYAIRSFYRGRGSNPGAMDYPNLSGNAGDLAQTVQRSAFPGRYAAQLNAANRLLESFSGGAGAQGAGEFGSGAQGWPPRSWGRVASNTAAAIQFANARWPAASAFAGADRGVAASDHSWGKASDIMVSPLGQMPNPGQRRLGWQIANWFVQNAGQFGTKYVIWDKMITQGNGWEPYTRYGDNPGPTLGHYDHVHVSYLHKGGLVNGANPQIAIPQLFKGGRVKFDNTLANLHRGETVLTSRLSEKLENGIVDNSASSEYNLHIHPSPGMDVDKLADVVVRKIQLAEARKGTPRVIK